MGRQGVRDLCLELLNRGGLREDRMIQCAGFEADFGRLLNREDDFVVGRRHKERGLIFSFVSNYPNSGHFESSPDSAPQPEACPQKKHRLYGPFSASIHRRLAISAEANRMSCLAFPSERRDPRPARRSSRSSKSVEMPSSSRMTI